MSNKFGLKDIDLEELNNIFAKYQQIQTVKIFGSRAMNNYKPGSDVDLALFGEINFDLLCKINGYLNEESLMPYKFDVLIYDSLSNEALKKHIDLYGKVLYHTK